MIKVAGRIFAGTTWSQVALLELGGRWGRGESLFQFNSRLYCRTQELL
jgi:hypothetical protein